MRASEQWLNERESERYVEVGDAKYFRTPKPTCNVPLCENPPMSGSDSCLIHEIDGWLEEAVAAHGRGDLAAYDEAMGFLTELGATGDEIVRVM